MSCYEYVYVVKKRCVGRVKFKQRSECVWNSIWDLSAHTRAGDLLCRKHYLTAMYNHLKSLKWLLMYAHGMNDPQMRSWVKRCGGERGAWMWSSEERGWRMRERGGRVRTHERSSAQHVPSLTPESLWFFILNAEKSSPFVKKKVIGKP